MKIKPTPKTKTNKQGHTRLGKELIAGAKEMLAHMRGEIDLLVHDYHPPTFIDVTPIRKHMGMSQSRFASAFGLNVSTLRDWEQGRRQPDPMARILLAVIARNPALVQDVLRSGA